MIVPSHGLVGHVSDINIYRGDEALDSLWLTVEADDFEESQCGVQSALTRKRNHGQYVELRLPSHVPSLQQIWRHILLVFVLLHPILKLS
jgi:hypothetical protein